MKYLKIVLFALSIAVSLSAQVDTNSQSYYLYIYFLNDEQELGARLAFSNDGINWQKYNEGKSVIAPILAKGEVPLMRDPNVLYDSSTGVFHLTWTTAWNQDNIGYATSTDLINWSTQVMIPVGAKIPGCKVCWAPELLYDELKDSIMVYWSTDRGTVGKEAFYSMTKDFRYFSTPKVYFTPKTADGQGYNIIDETIIKIAQNKYYMFCKDERTAMEAMKVSKNIHYVVGSTPQGPWEKGEADDVSAALTGPGTEGPTSCIIGDELMLFFDPYNSPQSTDRTRVIKVADLMGAVPPPSTAWKAGAAMKTAEGPFLPGHGSVSKVPRAKVMQVLYGVKDATVYPKSWKHPLQDWVYVGEASGYVKNPADTIAAIPTGPVKPVRVYPTGKRNTGCGTGVGLALLIPIGIRGAALRRRKQASK